MNSIKPLQLVTITAPAELLPPTVYKVDPTTGDGTWDGPQSTTPPDLNHPRPSLEDANFVLNTTARLLATRAPAIHAEAIKSNGPFLKVAHKIAQLQGAATLLGEKRLIPDWDLLKIQIFMSAHVYMARTGMGVSLDDALKEAYLDFAAKNGLAICDTDTNRLLEDAFDPVFFSDSDYAQAVNSEFLDRIREELDNAGGDADFLFQRAAHDRHLLRFAHAIQSAIHYGENYLNLARIMRNNLAGYWLTSGDDISIKDMAALLDPNPQNHEEIEMDESLDLPDLTDKRTLGFVRLLDELFDPDSGDVFKTSGEVPDDEQNRAIRKFHDWLASGAHEEKLKGFACYKHHQPPIELPTKAGGLKVDFTLAATDGLISGFSLTTPEGKTEPILVFRIAKPLPKDDIFIKNENRLVIVRPDHAPQIVPFTALGPAFDSTLQGAAHKLLEELTLFPRYADSRGKLLRAGELKSHYLNGTLKEPKKILGFRDYPRLRLVSEVDTLVFNHMVFVHEGQALDLTIEEKTGATRHVLVIRDIIGERFVIVEKGAPEILVGEDAIGTASEFHAGLIEASLKILFEQRLLSEIPTLS